MEVKIQEQERNTLKQFINLKIPLIIKNNEYSYKFDLMECYEEMFNSSHSLLDGYKVRENEIHCVFDNEFTILLEALLENEGIADFSFIASNVIKIMKKYVYKI